MFEIEKKKKFDTEFLMDFKFIYVETVGGQVSGLLTGINPDWLAITDNASVFTIKIRDNEVWFAGNKVRKIILSEMNFQTEEWEL